MPEMDMGLAPRQNPKKPRKKKKQSLGQSIVTGLFPCKGDSSGEIVRKLVFLLALIVLVAAVIMIALHFLRYAKLDREAAVTEDGRITTTDGYVYELKNQTPTTGQIQNLPQGTINEKYASLYSENKDFIGWLDVPGTNIDEPVVQTDNNDDYLHKNFRGEEEFAGTLFADYEGQITPDSMPHNTVIYGHNMRLKYKFAALHSYKENIEFLKVSPLINFNTLYQNNMYKIFSVFVTNISTDHGEVFDYNNRIYFDNKAEFYDFVLECEDRSIYETGVDIEYGDEFLTLSTCDKDTGMDLRLVIVARKLRDNEQPDVDPEGIVRKDSVKYFKVYEDIFGKQWKGRTWDTSLVKGMDEYIAENHLEDDPANYENNTAW